MDIDKQINGKVISFINSIVHIDATISKDLILKMFNEEWDKFDKTSIASDQMETYQQAIEEYEQQIVDCQMIIAKTKAELEIYKEKIPKLRRMI